MDRSWIEIYRNVVHFYDRDDELVTITRETARLALSTLTKQNEEDAHHNFLAAEYELNEVLSD